MPLAICINQYSNPNRNNFAAACLKERNAYKRTMVRGKIASMNIVQRQAMDKYR